VGLNLVCKDRADAILAMLQNFSHTALVTLHTWNVTLVTLGQAPFGSLSSNFLIWEIREVKLGSSVHTLTPEMVCVLFFL
jgi:hypothetical protein